MFRYNSFNFSEAEIMNKKEEKKVDLYHYTSAKNAEKIQSSRSVQQSAVR